MAHRSLVSLFPGLALHISHQMSHRLADVVLVDRFDMTLDETHCTLVACESG